ncbi:hypothetical protein, partial [Limosilactobacillus sp.]|uniref:hypothetical protein n=1 Tax=Limosilactobacillus sp. TaxID=2773925 RepID=UPI0025C5CE4F
MTDYVQNNNVNRDNTVNRSISGKVNGNTALVEKTNSGGKTPTANGGSLIINSVSGDMQHPVQVVSFTPNSAGQYNPVELKTPQGVLLDKQGNQITSFDPTRMMAEGRNEIIYLADMFIGNQQQSFAILGTQVQEKLINIQNDRGVKTSFALSTSPYLNDPQRTQLISFKQNSAQQSVATLPALKADQNGQPIAGENVGTYQLTFAVTNNAVQLKVAFYNNDLQYEGRIAPVYIIANDEFSRTGFIQYQPNILLPQYHLQRKMMFSDTTTTPFLYTNLTLEQYQAMIKQLYSNSSYVPQITARKLILPNGQHILELPITKLSFVVNGQEVEAKVLKQKLIGGGVNTYTIVQGNKIHFQSAVGFSGQTSPIKLLVKTANGDSHEVDFTIDVAKYDIKNTTYVNGQQGESQVEAVAPVVLSKLAISAAQPAVFLKNNKTTTIIEMTANGQRIGEAEIETDTGAITYYPERSFVGTVDPQTICIFMRSGR